jgi:hypothetical protein
MSPVGARAPANVLPHGVEAAASGKRVVLVHLG